MPAVLYHVSSDIGRLHEWEALRQYNANDQTRTGHQIHLQMWCPPHRFITRLPRGNCVQNKPMIRVDLIRARVQPRRSRLSARYIRRYVHSRRSQGSSHHRLSNPQIDRLLYQIYSQPQHEGKEDPIRRRRRSASPLYRRRKISIHYAFWHYATDVVYPKILKKKGPCQNQKTP